MIYFLAWLIYISVEAGQDTQVQVKFLIFLTTWGFLCFNAYLLVAAISVTVPMVYYHVTPPLSRTLSLTNKKEKRQIKCTPLSCVTGLYWATGIIGLEFAVAITVLFWIFFNDPALYSHTLSVSSIHVHMLNGIIAFLDTWISGIPFRILHFVYAVLFGCTYVIFSGVYYSAQGTDPSGNRYIYPVLDYGSHPELAAGVAIGCGLAFPVFLHFVFYLMYLARYWLSYLLQTKVYGLSVEHTKTETSSRHIAIEYA